ncbi:MAG: siphovirus Gp157 family protein [Methyloceanibacter sp.]
MGSIFAIRSLLLDGALQTGLRARLEAMKERLARLEERENKKRLLALEAMSEAGISKLEAPDFTASIRAGTRSVTITAEPEIPDSYWIPQAPEARPPGRAVGTEKGCTDSRRRT